MERLIANKQNDHAFKPHYLTRSQAYKDTHYFCRLDRFKFAEENNVLLWNNLAYKLERANLLLELFKSGSCFDDVYWLPGQCDQKIEKIGHFLKVSKISAQNKMPKHLHQKSIWKFKNILNILK
jgi:hypothetical protein